MIVENGILLKVDEKDIELLNKNPKKFWEGIYHIGDGAFQDCTSLKNIEIPNSVTSIGKEAFQDCSNLENIVIPNSVTAIGDFAFSYCTNLKKIEIPNSVKSIGNSAFASCTSLNDIEIPNSVTAIGDSAFFNCTSLKEIDIPNSVTAIGNSAFVNCTSLKEINIPNSVTAIGDSAFENCSNLKEIDIPNSVTAIGNSAFVNCTSLKEINIPNSVTAIGDSAFENCINTRNIEIPNSVTSIGDRAFQYCTSLGNIEIPNSVTSIGKSAFYGVRNVQIQDKHIIGDILSTGIFELIKNNPNINLKQLTKIYSIAKNKGINVDNTNDFLALCYNIGMLENRSSTLTINKNGKTNNVPICDLAYTFIQGLINHNELALNDLHMNLQDLKFNKFNINFARFVVNKNNWSDIKENLHLLSRIYAWFDSRANLDLENNEYSLLPTTEENRYKILVYETAENGIDRMHWRNPTVELLLKEFANNKFVGINTPREKEIAEYLTQYNIYTQKHFEKAKEIDEERRNSGVQDILRKPISQDRISSLDEYREKTKQMREKILSDASEVLSKQIEDTSSIFTYEVLSKDSVENFAMGCMTSCCATLYGAGAGAMRAMINHPDIQPFVIRDFDNKIISFGIIYVNREQGYAVVNDFEVNKKYMDRDEQRKAIYDKAMEGIRAFVKEYNLENPEKPIRKVTSGISPNWTAINDYIRQNPKSEILKAPNFNDFKYAGSGLWPGDWHREQYKIFDMGGK